MAQFVIPVDGADGHYDLDVELGGTVYTLTLAWNTRAEHWTIAIAEFQGDTIVSGEVIRADWGLFKRHHDERLPSGTLMAIDMSDEGRDPTEDDLGVRVLLVYDDGEG